MRTIGFILIFVSGMMLGIAIGIEWYKRNHPPTITIQRAAPPPARAATLFTCPMSKRDIEQYAIFCRGRARSDAVKPTERTP